MLRGPSQSQIDQWKTSLHTYEKHKRTKRPFGSQHPQMQRNIKPNVLEKQMRFNPVLIRFRDERQQQKTIEHEQIQKMNEQMQHLKNNYKYNTDYDIVNYQPSITVPKEYKSESLGQQNRKRLYKDPIYNQFNILNGKAYPAEYLQKQQCKTIRYPERRISPKPTQPYDIISGKYDINRETIEKQREALNKSEILTKYSEMRTIDNVTGRYYNPEKEQQYQRNQKEKSLHHAQAYFSKLPPSYQTRQPYIQQWTPPLSPTLQTIDTKNKNAKQRYHLRYTMEHQHKIRNDYLEQLKQSQTKNRVHSGRILEQKGKQFNIINSQRYANSRAETLFGKQIIGSPYDVRPQSLIKQNGFDQYY